MTTVMKDIDEKIAFELSPIPFLGMAPSILVAPPSLGKGPFEEAVILLTHHHDDGSMGFILNRPIGLRIQDLLEKHEEEHKNTQKPILFGGPVAKNSGFIIYEHEDDNPLDSGIFVTKNISISPARKILDKASKGELSGNFELLLGYCGWKKNQLVKELKKGEWLHLPFERELVFDVLPEDRWYQSFRKNGFSPYSFMEVPGGAQA